MEDDDFGDLYTDVDPQRRNVGSRGPPLQVTGHNIYGNYGEDDDEDGEFFYGSFKAAEHSTPRVSTSILNIRVSAQKTIETLEKDSEEVLYGLLDDGGFGDASKEPQFGENQKSVKQEISDKELDGTSEIIQDVQTKDQKRISLHSVVEQDVLEHLEDTVKIASQDDTNNSAMRNVHQKPEILALNQDEDGEFGADIAPPGLSTGANIADFSAQENLEDEWASKGAQAFETEADDDNVLDSDSEDDLQILLNDDNPVFAIPERGMDQIVEGSEDEDEEDLVIVTVDEPPSNRDWGDDQLQASEASAPASTGDPFVPGLVTGTMIDERVQGVKASVGAAANMSAPRLGYTGKSYHQLHHSQFKYVRPGLAAPAGGSNAATTSHPQGTILGTKTLSSAGNWASGRGVGGPSMRGDWAGAGRSASGSQRPTFGGGMLYDHSGRKPQYGMEFSLPPGKSVFDIDLDAFEEKPWRNPAVDLMDYFNFNFNETTWKQYCSQLAQLRLESTMQSKIQVYESGRSDQEYDPDLPPELRAAAGVQEGSTETNRTQSRMPENGYHYMGGRGQGTGRDRGMFPPSRNIQVEGGGAGRNPSTDLRRPRMRDFDPVVQIVLHDPEAEETNDEPDVEEEDEERQEEQEEVPGRAEEESMQHDEYEEDDEGKKPAKPDNEGHIPKSGYGNRELEPVLGDWGRNSIASARGRLTNMGPHVHNVLDSKSVMYTDAHRKFHSGLGRPADLNRNRIPDHGILPGPPHGPSLMVRGGLGRPYGGPKPGLSLPGLLPNPGISDKVRPIIPRPDYNEPVRSRGARLSTPPQRSPHGHVQDSDGEHSKSSEVQRGSKGSRARSESKEQNYCQQEWHEGDAEIDTTPAGDASIDRNLEQDLEINRIDPLLHEVSERERSLSQDDRDEGLVADSEDREPFPKRHKIYAFDDRSKSGSEIMKTVNASDSEISKDTTRSSRQHSSRQSVEEENSDFLLKDNSVALAHGSDEPERDVFVKEWESSKLKQYRPEGEGRVITQDRGVRNDNRREEWYKARPFRQKEEFIPRSAKLDHLLDHRGMVERDGRMQRRKEQPPTKNKEDETKRKEHFDERWQRKEQEREWEKERERDRERERERGRERDDLQSKERCDIQRRKPEEQMHRKQQKEDESIRDAAKERDELPTERRDLQRRKPVNHALYHRQRREEEKSRDVRASRQNEKKFWAAYNQDEICTRRDVRAVPGVRDDHAKDSHGRDSQHIKIRKRSGQLREADGRARHLDVSNELAEDDRKVARDRNPRYDNTAKIRKGYSDPLRQVQAPSPYKDKHRWPNNLNKGGKQGRNGSRSMMHEYASNHSSSSKNPKIDDFEEKASTRMSDDKGADISQPQCVERKSLGQKNSHGAVRRSKPENSEAHISSKDEDYLQKGSLSLEENGENHGKGHSKPSKHERWTSQKEKVHLPSKVVSKDQKMKYSDHFQHSGTQIDDKHKEEVALSTRRHRVDRKRDQSQEDQSQVTETIAKVSKEKLHFAHTFSSQEQEKLYKQDGKENLISEALDDPRKKLFKKEHAEEHSKDKWQIQSQVASSLARRKERFKLQVRNDLDSDQKHMQVDDEIGQNQEQAQQSEMVEEVKQERPARKRRWGGG